MEDSMIIDLLFQRAERVIELLADKFGKQLQTMTMHILGSTRDAEECVNDTYLAVWNVIPPKKPDPLAGFVYKTGRNLALKRHRENTAVKRNCSYDLSLDELAGCIPAAALEETLEARALGLCIDTFLSTLSDENRRIFLRRYWFGDSAKEIAASFRLQENTVNVRLSRIRLQLKAHLLKEGYTDA